MFPFFFVIPPEHRGPRGLCNHRSHGDGHLPGSVRAGLHRVHLQEAPARLLPGDLGVLGRHGLPLHVFRRDHLSLGSGEGSRADWHVAAFPLSRPRRVLDKPTQKAMEGLQHTLETVLVRQPIAADLLAPAVFTTHTTHLHPPTQHHRNMEKQTSARVN